MRRALISLAICLALATVAAEAAAAPRSSRVVVSEALVYPDWYFLGMDWYDPWYQGPFYGPGYVYLMPAPADRVPIELHVHPWKAGVRVDGGDVGRAREYDVAWHPLWLKPGHHVIEFTYPGFAPMKEKIDLLEGQSYDLHYRLKEGVGE